MNRSIKDVAMQYVDVNNLKEGMLNRVESAIRCYDPCLSCSTHAMGQMPMIVDVLDADGNIIRHLERE
jgi:NAD-reducing hydrogenase large subunit